MALAYGFSVNQCLIQFLHLRSLTLGNYEIELLAEALHDYKYLTEIDLSHNRLEGSKGGGAISKLIARGMNRKGGDDLKLLNLSHNKLGDFGCAAIINELLQPGAFIETLNLSCNQMEEIKFTVALEPGTERIFAVTNFNLDENRIK